MSKKEVPRANPTIWRLAKWLYNNIGSKQTTYGESNNFIKNIYYDKALELYRKTDMVSTINLE